MVIIAWLISVFISMLLLFWVVSSAIDSSNMAKDLKEIKELLNNQEQVNLKKSQIQKNELMRGKNENDQGNMNEERFIEECPGCGDKVWSTDSICGSCGLKLIIAEEETCK